MKQETLKKIIELAEGFAYDDSMKIFHMPSATFVWYKEIEDWGLFPLLLRRAVEGWNIKNLHHEIVSGRLCMDIVDWEGEDNFQYSNYRTTGNLTPKEQAIEDCLIELLEE